MLKRLFAFLVLLSPFLYLLCGVVMNTLGPDPAKSLINISALTAMTLLYVVLLLSLLAKFGIQLLPYRRMLGLYVFFYASMHVLTVSVYEFGGELSVFLAEVVGKPFMWLGLLAWLLLLPLALTSTKACRRRLKNRWKSLHRLSYMALLAVAIHYGMQLRGDLLIYLWLVPLTGYILSHKLRLLLSSNR